MRKLKTENLERMVKRRKISLFGQFDLNQILKK